MEVDATSTSAGTQQSSAGPGSSQAPPGEQKAPVFLGIDRKHRVTTINFLLCMSCQVNETAQGGSVAGEQTSRRCVNLLCSALQPHIWPDTDVNVQFLDKLLHSAENTQTGQVGRLVPFISLSEFVYTVRDGAFYFLLQNNSGNVCTALEIVTRLIDILPKPSVVVMLKSLTAGLAVCLRCVSSKVVNSMQIVLTRIFAMHPSNTVAPLNPDTGESVIVPGLDKELEGFFLKIKEVIDDGLQTYEKPNSPVSSKFLACFPRPFVMFHAFNVAVSFSQSLFPP